MQQVIDALEAERAEVQEHLEWLDRKITEFRARFDGERPAPPVTPRPATTRRTTARRQRGDMKAQIVSYLRHHPESTAGAVAKAINANRNTTATRLSQMAKEGEIAKAQTGYVAK